MLKRQSWPELSHCCIDNCLLELSPCEQICFKNHSIFPSLASVYRKPLLIIWNQHARHKNRLETGTSQIKNFLDLKTAIISQYAYSQKICQLQNQNNFWNAQGTGYSQEDGMRLTARLRPRIFQVSKTWQFYGKLKLRKLVNYRTKICFWIACQF